MKSGSKPPPEVVRKLLPSAIELGDDRQVKFTISNASVDRDNDVVSLSGWELDPFKANPVVLWGHNASELPIAKCVAIGVEGGALKAVVEFVPADMPKVGQLAEAVLRMCRTGFLSATSVGFKAIEVELAKERMSGDDDWSFPLNFMKQELCEFSVVSVPANAEALIDPSERMLPPVAAVQERMAEIEETKAEEKKPGAVVGLRLALIRAYG